LIVFALAVKHGYRSKEREYSKFPSPWVSARPRCPAWIASVLSCAAHASAGSARRCAIRRGSQGGAGSVLRRATRYSGSPTTW